MLYDRLLLDLSRAEQAQVRSDWGAASDNLVHAQAIIAELTGSLRTDVWDGADGVLALYNYIGSALISANIHRDVVRTQEAIGLLEPLRQAWHEAADALVVSGASARSGELGVA
jgi:flagellar protein FliS